MNPTPPPKNISINLTVPQEDFVFSEAKHPGLVAGYGCVAADTRIITEFGPMRIADIDRPMRVLSWNEKNQRFQLSLSGGAFPKGKEKLIRVEGPQGEFDAASHHRIFSSQGTYEQLGLHGASVCSFPLDSILESARLSSREDDLHYNQTISDWMGGYADEARQYGQRFLTDQDTAPVPAPSPDDVRTRYPSDGLFSYGYLGGLKEPKSGHTRLDQYGGLIHTDHSVHRKLTLWPFEARQILARLLEHICDSPLGSSLSAWRFAGHHTDSIPLVDEDSSGVLQKIENLSIQVLDEEQPYYDLQVLETNNYVCAAGFIHHNSGKSRAAVVRIAIRALQYPKLSFAFLEPTFDLVRLIAYPYFMNLFDEWSVGYKLNRADNIITLENDAQIIFRSADTPERLVGFEVADAVIDEADTLRPEQAADVWAKMLGRCRQKKPDGTPNTLAAVSTPEGFGWMYETFGKELKPGYELIRAPTSSNPYLPPGYVAQLEATYSSAQLAAYLDGQFVNLNSGSVYPCFDRKKNHTSATIKPGEPLHVGLDFNVANMSAVVHVMRDNRPYAVDELVKVFDTPEMVRILQERYRGHRIFVYPDASGSARKTNNASVSDHALLRAGGFYVCVNTRNPAVRDRILSMNKALEDGTYLINTDRCPMLAESLEKQAYNKNGEPDKTAGFDHQSDAAGYCIVYRFPIQHSRPRLALVVGI